VLGVFVGFVLIRKVLGGLKRTQVERRFDHYDFYVEPPSKEEGERIPAVFR